MKHHLELSKYLIKSFAKEKTGSAILELVIILAIFGVSAAVITPIVRTQLAETYNTESKEITFGGEKGDTVLTEAPIANSLPSVDTSTSTFTQKSYIFKFDGNTYVKLPNTLMKFGSGTSDYTIEARVKMLGSSKMALYAKNSSSFDSNQLYVGQSEGKYYFNYGPETFSPMSPITYETVHLVWVVRNNTMYFYENGVNVWTVSMGTRNSFSTDDPPKLGMDRDLLNGNLVDTDLFNGYMYEVRLYTKGLTQKEITNNYTKVDVTRSSLEAEYLFNDGKGLTIRDSSGNGNDAVVIGTPVWEVQ